MNQETTYFIIGSCTAFTIFVIGVFLGMSVLISDVKKKGTLKMKSGILRYIPNDVLDSHRGDIQ